MSETVEAPPVEPQAETPPEQPTQVAQAETPPVDDDAALEQQIAEQTIDLPEGEKLVPLSAVTTVREKLKATKAELADAKTGGARAQELEARIQQLEANLHAMAPKAQAFDAAVQAQRQPHQPQGPTPEDVAELTEIARDFDLYKADGTHDLDRARRIREREHRTAHSAARQAVAPFAQQTVSQQSRTMLERAKATAAPNGVKPDPAMLESVWSQLDPRLTATEAGAKQAWAVALGYTAAIGQQGQAPSGQAPQRNAAGQFVAAEVPAPLHTEKAGGRDVEPMTQLTAEEKRYLKDTGMTEKEYYDSAKSAPWLRR